MLDPGGAVVAEGWATADEEVGVGAAVDPVVAEEDLGVGILAHLAGHKLRIHYAAKDQAPKWRTVDPIGLVTVRDQGYLLATRSGADRTYRLSRVLAAEELAEPAQRPDRVDLDRAWQERSTRVRTERDFEYFE